MKARILDSSSYVTSPKEKKEKKEKKEEKKGKGRNRNG
jgi:hypothetical protein